MNLKDVFLTKNIIFQRNIDKVDYRYTDFQKNGPQGIIVHDTYAGNPELRRYVQPDDGTIGKNQYNNDWNSPNVGELLVHAFIGKLDDGSVATIQTAPLNFRGLHVGSGTKGSYNNSHIGFEICDDNVYDKNTKKLVSYGSKDYFNAVYKEAVEFCAYVCKKYSLNPLADGVILGHYEAYQRKMGSDHGDPQEWFGHFGKSMDTLRADVNAELNKSVPVETPSPVGSGDNPSIWAKEATDWAKQKKIFVGDGKGNYDWQEVVTREQVAQILYNSSK